MPSRFWVGNGGNWGDTGHWSLTSGGASGAAVPTSSDDVFFDVNSFSIPAQTVQLNVVGNCLGFTVNGVTNSPVFSMNTLSSDILRPRGSFFLDGAMTFTGAFLAVLLQGRASAGYTITTNGTSLGAINILPETNASPSIGKYTLQDAISCASFGVLGSTNIVGNFDANGFSINITGDLTLGDFTNPSPIVDLGNGTITLEGDIFITSEATVISANTNLVFSGATQSAEIVSNGRSWSTITVYSSTTFAFEPISSVDADSTFIIQLLIISGPILVTFIPDILYIIAELNANAFDVTANLKFYADSDTSFSEQARIQAESVTAQNIDVGGIIASGPAAPFQAGGRSRNIGRNVGWEFPSLGVLPDYVRSLPSAIARAQQGLREPKFIVGGQTSENGSFGLFKKSDDYGFNVFTGPVWHIGFDFRVEEVIIPLFRGLNDNDEASILPVLYFDQRSDLSAGTLINLTNFEEDESRILLTGDNFPDGVKGKNNLCLELQFSGPDVIPVSLPITVIIANEKTGERSSFQITSIFEGFMPSELFGSSGQYLAATGIDPDMPANDDSPKASGVITPVSYTKFSGAEIDSSPIAVIPNPKDSNTYVVLANGKLLSVDSDFGTVTLIDQVSAEVARGAWYSNNFIYIATPNNVSWYGPLNDIPILTDDVWTGTTLGSQTALTDTDYPLTLFNVGYLNHYGFSHIDGRSYFLDFADGVGLVHMIHTMFGSAQGDTDDATIPSAYGFLDLPFDYLPIAGCSYGNDIVIGASQVTDSGVLQGKSALFFANPADTTPSFYRKVPLPGAICSALVYDNGVLYGTCGDLAGGYILFKYVGGDTIQTLKIIEDGYPPIQTAIDYVGNRVVFGASVDFPVRNSGLFAYGSKSDLFPRGLHHIAVLTDLQIID